jgi:alcohol dehydrogenase
LREANRGVAPAWTSSLGGQQVLFGDGAIDRLGELIRPAGARRVLIVSDRGVRDAGHVERARAALAAAGLATVVYDGVESNPTTRHVAEGLEVAQAGNVDGLVGLGGGSPMDCAKGVNFLLTNGGRMEDYRGTGKAAKEMLPSFGVPTTAGTGSEAQSYALISQEGTRVKMACGDRKAMFRAVVLDPALLATVPRGVAGVAGIDAVSHAVESWVSTRRNPVSQMLSREAWRRLAAALPLVMGRDADPGARGSMLLGAYLAGAAIEQSMLGAAHACANPLTARFPAIPHGVAVGLLLPHVVRFNSARVGALYDVLARDADPAGPPAPLEDRIRELRSAAGCPGSLRECAVPRGRLPEMAADAESQWTARFNPRPVSRQDLLALYEAAYE